MEDINYEATSKKKVKWKFIIGLIPIVALAVIIVSANIKLHNEKKAFVEQAESDLSKIASAFNEEDYSSVMSSLEDYKEHYSSDSSTYFSELPENLYGSTVSNEYETKVATKLYNDYKSLNEQYSNMSVTNASDADIDGIKKLLNTIYSLTDYFPNGFTYMDSNNATVKFDDIDTLKNHYNDLSVKKGIALFNKGDNGEAISTIKDVLSSEDLSDDTRNTAQTCLDNMLPRSRPKDFKILSGSKEVSVFESGKNYAWRCPYCGYINQAVGSASVFTEMDNHYIGEVSTISGMMLCPSLTGCGNLSSYTLTIEWK